MSDSTVFGNKEDFAIELGLTETPGKYKLCFWVQGKRMGNFTKAAELRFSIVAYEKFKNEKDDFYFEEFKEMKPTKIRRFLVDDLSRLARSQKEEDLQEYERRDNLRLFFGPQFSYDGHWMQLLYKEGVVEVLYSEPGKTAASSYSTSFENFYKVFEEYVGYCEEKKLAAM